VIDPVTDTPLCFEPPGSAGSSDECNDAKKSDCMVIEKSTAKSPQHETDCAVGMILADESCS
jgi:hypothetical protein